MATRTEHRFTVEIAVDGLLALQEAEHDLFEGMRTLTGVLNVWLQEADSIEQPEFDEDGEA